MDWAFYWRMDRAFGPRFFFLVADPGRCPGLGWWRAFGAEDLFGIGSFDAWDLFGIGSVGDGDLLECDSIGVEESGRLLLRVG
jgi:hypothetical protein